MNLYYATFRKKIGVQCFKKKWSDMDNIVMNENHVQKSFTKSSQAHSIYLSI